MRGRCSPPDGALLISGFCCASLPLRGQLSIPGLWLGAMAWCHGLVPCGCPRAPTCAGRRRVCVHSPVYLEAEAEAAQKRFFPGALLSSDLDAAVAATLYARGFSPKNTLFAHSVCAGQANLRIARYGRGSPSTGARLHFIALDCPRLRFIALDRRSAQTRSTRRTARSST